jgi:Protein of unknown function (DUF1360)
MRADMLEPKAQQVERPGPAEYASLNAVYAVALAGLVAGTRNRGENVRAVLGNELIPLSAATFAVSKMIARERIGSWVREPFVDDPVGRKRPRGGSVRRAVGELVTCSRCVGAWTALGFVGLRLAHPRAGQTATAVFAVVGFNDFAQAGFRALCEWSNREH